MNVKYASKIQQNIARMRTLAKILIGSIEQGHPTFFSNNNEFCLCQRLLIS